MDVVELNLRYQNHAERVFFAVTNLGKQNMIMGHTWLRKHNPDINWVTGDELAHALTLYTSFFAFFSLLY